MSATHKNSLNIKNVYQLRSKPPRTEAHWYYFVSGVSGIRFRAVIMASASERVCACKDAALPNAGPDSCKPANSMKFEALALPALDNHLFSRPSSMIWLSSSTSYGFAPFASKSSSHSGENMLNFLNSKMRSGINAKIKMGNVKAIGELPDGCWDRESLAVYTILFNFTFFFLLLNFLLAIVVDGYVKVKIEIEKYHYSCQFLEDFYRVSNLLQVNLKESRATTKDPPMKAGMCSPSAPGLGTAGCAASSGPRGIHTACCPAKASQSTPAPR